MLSSHHTPSACFLSRANGLPWCHLLYFLLHHALTILLSFLLDCLFAQRDRTPMGLWTAENTTHERRTVTALGRTSGGIAPYIATATYVAFTAAATVILAVTVASVVSANVVVAAAVTFTTTSAFLEYSSSPIADGRGLLPL